MSKHVARDQMAQRARIHAEPIATQRKPAPDVLPDILPALRADSVQPVVVDRSFEMPVALYAATVALYLGFVAVMAVGFASPGLAIPMAIFALFIVAGFGVPALWTRIAPDHGKRPLKLQQLMRRGIATYTGRLEGGDAAIQMLILPVLILGWGMAVVTIRAFV